MNTRILIALLLLLNVLVLMGQVYPAGAPPFAGTVNIIFLVANLLFLVVQIRRTSTAG